MREAVWLNRGVRVRVAVTEPETLPPAHRLVRSELAALRRVCGSRGRGTELSRLHHAAGTPVRVSPLLADLVRAALGAAEATGGDVDPTVGAALLRPLRPEHRAWLPVCGSSLRLRSEPEGWRRVMLRDDWLTVPVTVLLDLRATAKAYVARRCVERLAAGRAGGVLVAVGGVVASAGTPPPGGWRVPLADAGLMLAGGSFATSRGAARDPARPPIVDPRTGRPPAPVWRTVSVAAADCVTAKALSVAAVVRGHEATAWLADLGVRAQLVALDGGVRTVGAGFGAPLAAYL
jgi:thiamine biosynthesis lipoprotein